MVLDELSDWALKDRWLTYGYELCLVNSRMSKDPSTKVGAAILKPDRTVASTGWNGFPPGVPDRPEDYDNREVKYSRIVHAEMNAILGYEGSLKGCVLYVYPMFPCDRCAPHIIKAGISLVVAFQEGDQSRWKDSVFKSQYLFRAAGIPYYVRDVRQN